MDERSAFVGRHVHSGEVIHVAIFDAPAFPEDSGWVFLSRRDVEENDPFEGIKFWAVWEVLNLEPSLQSIINTNVIGNYHKNTHGAWELDKTS